MDDDNQSLRRAAVKAFMESLSQLESGLGQGDEIPLASPPQPDRVRPLLPERSAPPQAQSHSHTESQPRSFAPRSQPPSPNRDRSRTAPPTPTRRSAPQITLEELEDAISDIDQFLSRCSQDQPPP